MQSWAIPLAALVVSLMSFIYATWQQRHLASHREIISLNDRLKTIEIALENCEKERTRLQRENYDLMAELREMRLRNDRRIK